MSDSDNIRSYSSNDIQKYLKGDLSPAEMHEMEKAAMEDPFLADAIEGIEMTRKEHGDEIINTNLAELQLTLNEKSKSGRVIAMRPSSWWYAAAAIVLIISGVFTYNNLTNENTLHNATIAKGEGAKPPVQPMVGPADESASGSIQPKATESEKKITDTAVGNSLSNAEFVVTTKDYKSNSDGRSSGLIKTSDDKSIIHPAPKFRKDSSTVDLLEGRAAGVEIASSNNKESKKADSQNKDNEKVDVGIVRLPDAQSRSTQEESLRMQNNRANNFRGRVLDNNNQPVANATVAIEKENSATVTDRSGFFELNSKDTQPDVNVSVVGYASRKVELDNRRQLNEIKLEPDNRALNEVVVADKSKVAERKNNSSKGLSTKVQDASPVIGWMEFEKYLEKNKKVANNSKFKSGEVVVSFLVDKKGQLSSFRIEQSLGKEENAEATRLIKEGPAWKLTTTARRTRATVIIRF